MQDPEEAIYECPTFDRRSELLEGGKSDLILLLATLLYLRNEYKGAKFSISSSVDLNESITSFIDLIFVQNVNRNTLQCTMVWFPLGNNISIIKEEDFTSPVGKLSIQTMFNAYCSIKEFFTMETTKSSYGNFDDCNLVLFTRSTIDDKSDLGLKDVAEERNILNTDGRVSMFTKNSSVIKKSGITNNDDNDMFLDKLYIYHEQGDDRFKNLISTCFDLMNIKSTALIQRLISSVLGEVKNWLVQEKNVPFLSNESRILYMAFQEQIKAVNLKMEAEVDKIRVKFLAEAVEKSRNDILANQVWIEYSNSRKHSITTLYKIHHIVRSLGTYIFVGIQDLIRAQEEILSLWRSPFCTYMIVVIEVDTTEKIVSEISQPMQDILIENKSKKMIFISADDDETRVINEILNTVKEGVKTIL